MGGSKNVELENAIKLIMDLEQPKFKIDYHTYKVLYESLMVTTKQNLQEIKDNER